MEGYFLKRKLRHNASGIVMYAVFLILGFTIYLNILIDKLFLDVDDLELQVILTIMFE